MKHHIIRLIGILAIIIGTSDFVLMIVRATRFPESISLPFILYSLPFCVLIYGGYQTILQKALGRKLLLVFFTCELLKIALSSLFFLVFYFIFKNQGGGIEFNLQPFSPVSQEYVLWAYLACLLYYALSIIFFLRKSVAESFVAEEIQRIELIANALPLAAPGWAQALVNSYWQGIFSFFIFYYLVAENILNVEINGSTSSPQSLLLNYGIKFSLWAFFALNDWAFIRSAIKKQNAQTVSLHEDSHPDA